MKVSKAPWTCHFIDGGSLEITHVLNLSIIKSYNKKLYINLACLSVWVSVCLYPINVKTAETIGPKFFVGHHMTTGKVYQ